MTKSTAIHIILSCAKLYNENLLHKNLLFVFEDSSIEYIEIFFETHHYKHLTGVSTRLGAVRFYEQCTSVERLRERERFPSLFFELNPNAERKLLVLNEVMNIHTKAKTVGNFSSNKIQLKTDKVVGNTRACVGLKLSDESQNYYIPNTVLNENIRKVVNQPEKKILAIFRKHKSNSVYAECTYKVDSFDLSVLKSHEILKDKIAVE